MKNTKKPFFVFLSCILILFASMFFASLVQTNFGTVDVVTMSFETDSNDYVCYKLYVPDGVDSTHPAPAVLALHGYQNDKETSSAYAIEFARRGMVVMSIDEYGHGSTTLKLRERGWTSHKFPNIEITASGPDRYLTMMNFSNMDFFDSEISDGLLDTSMGGRFAFEVLQSFNFVQDDNIAITGHSMGTWSSWSTAQAYPEHKAIILQCGELFYDSYYEDTPGIEFHNVLLLQAEFDEFNTFRDYQNNLDGVMESELRYHDFALQDEPIDWDTTYGSFDLGTARRIELIHTNHRLTTNDSHAVAAACDWLVEVFDLTNVIESNNQTFMWKDGLVFLGLISALVSLLTMLVILLKVPFFASIVQPITYRDEVLLSKKKWWQTALISVLISAASYPFLTQLGHGLIPVPEDIFGITIANGYSTWFVFIAIVSIVTLVLWFKKRKNTKNETTLYDMGLTSPIKVNKLDWKLIGKSALIAVILCVLMYLYVIINEALFQLDLRLIWPMFKSFTWERFGQFFVYLPIYVIFFMVADNIKIFGQMRLKEYSSPVKTQLMWWLKYIVVCLGGLLVVVLIEYIPFFAGIGPGADLLFSSTFGGPFMSILILAVPQFAVLLFVAVYCFRKTGSVYVGSFLIAMMACWIVTAGSAFF